MLREHLELQLGRLRARLVGVPDTSENLFASVVDQMCTRYDQAPELVTRDERSHAVLSASFEEGGWWGMARAHQRYVRGLQESLVLVGWDDEDRHPTFSLVTPDTVTIESARTNKSRPVVIWHAQRREVRPGSSELAWFWDRWDVRDQSNPSLTVWSGDRKREVTGNFFDPSGWAGRSYPLRNDAGRPILPFALYHGGLSDGGVWSTGASEDVVTGSLQLGLLWTSAVHGVIRASFDQRYLANGRIKGGAIEKVNGVAVRTLDPDPTAIVMIDGENATAGSWGASIDIDKAESFVRKYGQRLAIHYGLSPGDVVVESVAESGVALTIRQEGKRRIERRDAPAFARGDSDLSLVVAAVNRAHGVQCSALGSSFKYHGVDLSNSERNDVGAYVEREMGLGLMDRVQGYRELHPGMSREAAAAELAEIDMQRLRDQIVSDLLSVS